MCKKVIYSWNHNKSMQATIDSMVTKMKRLSDNIHFVNFHHETQSKCILRFKIVTKTRHPSTVGYCRGSGRGLVFVTILLLKCIFSCVSCWEWTKWIYSDNLFIYKHCINLILYWFIMISISDKFPLHIFILEWIL